VYAFGPHSINYLLAIVATLTAGETCGMIAEEMLGGVGVGRMYQRLPIDMSIYSITVFCRVCPSCRFVARPPRTGMAMREKPHQQERAAFLACLEQTRLGAGLTQQQLAERMGTSDAVVEAWEIGTRRMDLAELRQLCSSAGVALPKFIDEFELALDQSVDT